MWAWKGAPLSTGELDAAKIHVSLILPQKQKAGKMDPYDQDCAKKLNDKYHCYLLPNADNNLLNVLKEPVILHLIKQR